jgi:hypothetical protein
MKLAGMLILTAIALYLLWPRKQIQTFYLDPVVIDLDAGGASA